MNRYRVYGLTLATTLTLPELQPERSGVPADVVIEVEHEAAPPDKRYSLDVQLDDIRFENEILQMRAIGGTSLIVHANDLGNPAVRQYVVGPGLAMILLQRGLTLLHASAVAIDGGAYAFAADSGVGKSTLAAALYARGHELITDDLCAIENGAVMPAMSLLKVAERSLTALPRPGMLIDIETEGEGRLRFGVERLATAPMPLRTVYLIEDAGEIAARSLYGSDVVLALVRHSYWQDLVASGVRAMLLRQAGALAKSIEVCRLRRPRDLSRIAEVAEWVERHARGLAE